MCQMCVKLGIGQDVNRKGGKVPYIAKKEIPKEKVETKQTVKPKTIKSKGKK